MLVPMFFFLPKYLWPNPRYVTFLLPVGALLAARAIVAIHRAWRWPAYALAVSLVATNLLVLPLPLLMPTSVAHDKFDGELESGTDAWRLGALRPEIEGYAYELTHRTRGADEALAAFLSANTDPDDLVFMTNEWLSSMFHTGRRFACVAAPTVRERFPKLPSYVWDATQARWFVLRRSRDTVPISAYRAQVLAAVESRGLRVEKSVVLDAADARWINREILSKHVFRPSELPAGGIEVWRLSRVER
jgi:hypothetical protein